MMMMVLKNGTRKKIAIKVRKRRMTSKMQEGRTNQKEETQEEREAEASGLLAKGSTATEEHLFQRIEACVSDYNTRFPLQHLEVRVAGGWLIHKIVVPAQQAAL